MYIRLIPIRKDCVTTTDVVGSVGTSDTIKRLSVSVNTWHCHKVCRNED